VVKELCEYGDEVARALAIKAPVVALETTVVTHGLPHPDLVANPIPIADEMASQLYDRALHTALSEAETRRIRGRAVTPFLLDRMRAVTGGESVRANVALLRHNAQVAAALAVAGV
jgi:pseudouridine-5'-phosphate glycosidase